MKIENALREKLQKTFAPVELELTNESHAHGFSRGPEGHFKLFIVSETFKGMNKVQRHQSILGLVKDEMAAGIHALTIRALTPEEQTQDSGNFSSPACQHRD